MLDETGKTLLRRTLALFIRVRKEQNRARTQETNRVTTIDKNSIQLNLEKGRGDLELRDATIK